MIYATVAVILKFSSMPSFQWVVSLCKNDGKNIELIHLNGCKSLNISGKTFNTTPGVRKNVKMIQYDCGRGLEQFDNFMIGYVHTCCARTYFIASNRTEQNKFFIVKITPQATHR